MKKQHIIRRGNIGDIPNIMEFIKINWNKEHILGNSYEYMAYQHVQKDRLCFIVGENMENKSIYGIEGYIPYSFEENLYCSLALWKVIKSSDVLLGIKILIHIKKTLGFKEVFCNGINKNTFSTYRYLGFHIDKLSHYYRIADKTRYNIAKIQDKVISPYIDSNFKLNLINNFDQLENNFNMEILENRKPFKDMWYIKHRYFENPIYKYNIYAITDHKAKFNSFLITREILQDCVKILRIVDFIGLDEELCKISTPIQDLIEKNSYEYIDFYCYGISAENMESAGFKIKDSSDKNIIPNYFEPFVQKNIDIYFATTDINGFCMFKGDGDQDRPNFWK